MFYSRWLGRGQCYEKGAKERHEQDACPLVDGQRSKNEKIHQIWWFSRNVFPLWWDVEHANTWCSWGKNDCCIHRKTQGRKEQKQELIGRDEAISLIESKATEQVLNSTLCSLHISSSNTSVKMGQDVANLYSRRAFLLYSLTASWKTRLIRATQICPCPTVRKQTLLSIRTLTKLVIYISSI